ncbi:MAG: 3-deoxy-D-manno-octulosonic acid transferase [Pirellulaceae bacterium]|nr:3-deoxy-D-manno-octulosonic acid transferase [Pirellulaceae bacterium]
MRYLYNFFYLALLLLFSPWLIYQAIAKGKYRQGWGEKIWGHVPVLPPLKEENGRGASSAFSGGTLIDKRIWVHAVSLGEVQLLGALLKEFEQKYPTWEIVISTTTKTGYDTAKKKYPHRTVFYCPIDFSWAVKTAMQRIKPDLLLLAELEIWPNLITAAKEVGAGVAIVNGRLSEKSLRGYQRIRFLLSPILNQFDLIAVQNENYGKRFAALSDQKLPIEVTGSLKFDGAQTDRTNSQTVALKKAFGITENETIFLAGSTQSPEEEYALATFLSVRKEFPKLRLLLVPRHPHRFDIVADLLEKSDVNYCRRSTVAIGEVAPSDWEVLLVDTVGELGAWWGVADIGFVGGSMGSRGGQNMIEPAAYGVALCFGPNTKNFQEIVELLLDSKGAVVVNDRAELEVFLRKVVSDDHFAKGLGEQARSIVYQNLGAAAKTAAAIERL